VCIFGTRAIGVEEMIKILSTITGWNLTADQLMRIGERIYNLERLVAVREGILRKDDTLPPRILEEQPPEIKTPEFSEKELNKMLDEYYEIRGWDADGRPKKGKFEELEVLRSLEE
jgi:aldehyde:ferredoxin oxidoreductase